MSLPESMAAYGDCYDFYDRAQDAPKGIRIPVADRPAATQLRLRLNQARVLQRREAMRLYDRTDPRYGKSINDKFRVTTREGPDSWWVYIEAWCAEAYEGVEELE